MNYFYSYNLRAISLSRATNLRKLERWPWMNPWHSISFHWRDQIPWVTPRSLSSPICSCGTSSISFPASKSLKLCDLTSCKWIKVSRLPPLLITNFYNCCLDACNIIKKKIDDEKLCDEWQKEWHLQNREEIRVKFLERHEQNIKLEKKSGVKKEYLSVREHLKG